MNARISLAISMILALTAGCASPDSPNDTKTASTAGETPDDAPAVPAADSPSAAPSTPSPATADTGAVFTLSNDATKNEVLAFTRKADGSLEAAGTFATGGKGTGMGLGSQGALAFSPDGKVLVAVDAGSNEITSFAVDGAKLTLRSHVAADGEMPVSVAVSNDLVYVANAGGTNCITGFRLGADGKLTEIEGSKHALSAATVGPAQVAFSPKGDALVVTEKMTNRIDTFAVLKDGRVTDGYADTSVGMTPFGFTFSPDGRLFVTEAFGGAPGASATSSYDLVANPDERVSEPLLAPISRSVKTNQTAACWIAVTSGGKWAFTSNTPNHNISAYSISAGTLTLRGDGATLATGDGTKPSDLALSSGDRFLYALNVGTHEIAIAEVAADGALTKGAASVPVPESAVGLLAR